MTFGLSGNAPSLSICPSLSSLPFVLFPQPCADIFAIVILSECEIINPCCPPLVPQDSRLSEWYLCFVYSLHRMMLFFSQYYSLVCIIEIEGTSQPFSLSKSTQDDSITACQRSKHTVFSLRSSIKPSSCSITSLQPHSFIPTKGS